jgi:hypothetical protein
VFVWEDNVNPSTVNTNGNTIMYSIVSTTTGQVQATGVVSLATAGYVPRVMILGSYAVCHYSQSRASGKIYRTSINLANVPNATWSAAAAIPGLTVNTGTWWIWDAVPLGVQSPSTFSVGYLYTVVFQHSTGSNPLQIYIISFNAGTFATLTSASVSSIVGSSFTFQAITARWAAYPASGGGPAETLIWIAWVVDAASSSANTVYTAYSCTITTGPAASLGQILAPTVAMTATSTSAFVANGSIAIEDIGVSSGFNIQYVTIVHGGSVASGFPNVFGGIQWTTADINGDLSTVFAGYNLQLLSRPFAVSATDASFGVHVYAAVSDLSAQQSVVIVELPTNAAGVNTVEDSPRPCAMIAPRLSNFANPLQSGYASVVSRALGLNSLSSVTNISAPSAATFVVASNLTETNNAPSNLSVIQSILNFAHPGLFKSVSLGALTYTGGGIPGTFDGMNLTETATVQSCSNGGGVGGAASLTGGLLQNATYQYVVVPEWRDARGNVSQGPPSSPITVIMGGSLGAGTVQLTIPCITTTQKGISYRTSVYDQSNMYLVPYRTFVIGGSAGGGGTVSTTFNRVVGDDPGSALVNQEYAGSITYNDITSDATVAENEPLYTTGGLISNDAPSSFADICTHSSRVYGIGDDLQTIWISTVQQPGQPCSFSDQSQTTVPGIGNLVAIWSMDANLFAASSTGIAYATGDGPNLAGQQSDLSPWTPIPVDVGVIDPRACCVTPLGTVFRHQYGLGLLDRSLQVHSDFGDPVIDLLKSYPTTTAIVQHPTREEVLVFCTSPTSGGVILSYNTRFQSWSSWFINDADAGSTPGTPNAAIAIGGAVQYGSPYGRVWTENATAISNPVAGSFYDAIGSAQTYVSLQVSTGWIKPGGGLLAQGWVRQVMIQFQNQELSTITAQIGYDYGGSLTSPSTWVFGASTLEAFPDFASGESKLGLVPPMARCGAFRMVYTDTVANGVLVMGTGQGPRIVGLSAMVDALPGQYRLPAVQGG